MNAVSAVPPTRVPATGSSSGCCGAPTGARILLSVGAVVPLLKTRSTSESRANVAYVDGAPNATLENDGLLGSAVADTVSRVL